MDDRPDILVFGDGRIGRAIKHHLKLYYGIDKVAFLRRSNEAGGCRMLIGAVPGEMGEECLELALRYKKNLIDVSDIDPPFYLKRKKEIVRRGITVIPECGFSPGLVNLIIGYEARRGGVKDIEVKAGSLSKRSNFFPFLWCFEDLVLEHRLESFQCLGSRVKRLGPFSGYRREDFLGIPAETYLCASGFEHLFRMKGIRNFTCRVIRPLGFMPFFRYLQNHGFLNKGNLGQTKKLLEKQKEDNFTLAEIIFSSGKKQCAWRLKGFSRENEALNSMQKITAGLPSAMANMLLKKPLSVPSGLVFMEDISEKEALFRGIVRQIRSQGISFSKHSL